ncbi:ketopantoate reductase family protein [Sediminibacillus massiliensis]|uniref:ketopantoate reductase family protein n=1 Tax=Sediminibacillus massiliensis TaxID=1926277 RepID=UPI00098854DC|nr:2-dehydropantoate 2-reductase [Sediminibacillus massiliensis]
MNIVILGAGALGAYFGARWEEAGQNVTFLVREKRARKMEESGLYIHNEQGDYSIDNPKIAQKVEEIENPDLVLLSVKGYHLEGTLESLEELVAKGAKVLPILNGVEHISTLQTRLGKENVLGGLSFIIATLDDNGGVLHSSKFHDLVFGPLDSSQRELCEQLLSVSERANFQANLSLQINEAMWNKYMFINAFSGITAAANLPIGEIRKHQETFRIAELVLKEMKDLANKHGIELTDDHINHAVENLKSLGDEATSSMHQDRRKRLTLEVEHLHGGALRLADAVGMTLPYTETIYALIKPYENQ